MKRILGLSLLAALAACNDGPTGPDQRVPDVGEEIQLNVQFDDNCANPVSRNGRVMAVSNRAIIVADVTNPASGFTDADYQAFASSVDNLVWPTTTAAFGEPDDIDRNARVIFFFTRAINDLTPPGASSYVNGLFFSRDLFPKRDTNAFQACPSSNFAEMVYMLVPDPSRGGVFAYEQVKRNTLGVMAHEMQHLISASRRLYKLNVGNDGWNEVVWLNEGLSHIAEELVFYQATGLSPRRNLNRPTLESSAAYAGAFNAYMLQNTSRFSSFLGEPERNSPYETDDDLATRGAIWHYLRYVADRRAADDNALWNALVNARQTGMTNLRTALGTDPIPLFRDWAVTVYLDDAVANADARFQEPSWNFRSIFTTGLPLRTRMLVNGGTTSLSLDPGGAAYLRFGVGAGQAELRVNSGGSAPQGACTAVPALAVGQVYTANPAAGQALCVQGAGEYTLVAFYGAETEGDPLPVSVSGTGIQAVTGPPNPSVAAFTGPAFTLNGVTVYREDVQVRRKLQERSREMGAYLKHGGGPRLSQTSVPDPTRLYLSVARTR